MEKLGADALQRRVAELERENSQLRSHIAELQARLAKLEHDAQTMHEVIWESARTSSRPPPPQPPRPSGTGGADGSDGDGT